MQKIIASDDLTLLGGVEHETSPHLGDDLGTLSGNAPLNLQVVSSLESLLEKAHAVIDFTRPEATLQAAALTAKYHVPHIVGTTGMDESEKNKLAEYATQTTIIHAHNMSLGVNLLQLLIKQVAEKLPEKSFDIEIVEMHHKHKIDAPSGTALSLGAAAKAGRKLQTGAEPAFKLSREGKDDPRQPGEIGFATLRGGGVIGEHSVIFASEEERITLSHHAESRDVFAAGALQAARWAQNAQPGKLHSMHDVIGL